MVLPMTKASGLTGAMRICSMVPRSFSRTTASDVEITAVIMVM